MTLETRQVQDLLSHTISTKKLRVLGSVFDRVVKRAEETLESTPWGIRCWLRSPQRNKRDRRPFGRTQEAQSESRYIGLWKQMLYYCFRTCLRGPEVRERVYGIHFTREQERLIGEIASLLQPYPLFLRAAAMLLEMY